MSDPLRVHKNDQTIAAVRDVARITWAYFSTLIECGADRDDALELTLGYLAALTPQPSNDTDP